MRVRFFRWALVLSFCCSTSAAFGQQFAGYPAPTQPSVPGSYYAQVARQASAAGTMPLPSPQAYAAVAATMPGATTAAPPSMPTTYPGAAPARSPIAAGNPYAARQAQPQRPIPTVAGVQPTARKPQPPVQQAMWQQPRSFMQGVTPTVATLPLTASQQMQQGPTLGFPQAAAPSSVAAPVAVPIAGPNPYTTPLMAAAPQPTLAPPIPGGAPVAGMNSLPAMPSGGVSQDYGFSAAPADAFNGNYTGGATPVAPGYPAVGAPVGPGNPYGPAYGGAAAPWSAPVAGAPAGSQGGAMPFGPAPGTGYNPFAPGAPAYDGMFDEGAAAPSADWVTGGGCDPCAAGSCGPWFASVSGLYMTRDVPNNVGLTFVNTEPQLSILNTEQAGFDWKGGFEVRAGRMLGTNWAIEADYWYLDPSYDTISTRSEGNGISSRLDMSNVLYNGFALSNIYENSREQRVYRSNAFQNIEINLWQQALQVAPSGRYGMAFFTGVRYFKYREILEYGAVQAGSEFSDNNFDTQSWYHIRMRNNLIGWQVGGRGQLYLGQKFRLYAIPRAGLFANVISQQQDLCMVIDLHSDKTDIAFMGQLDLGASYQFFNCCSAFFSYRAMGIAGVANADDQIARDFDSLPDMAEINSSGSLILHGINAGLQFQF